MLALTKLCLCLFLVWLADCSTLMTPPQSALVIAFEDTYDLSLLANTLSDQGIDSTLIIPGFSETDLYENLIDVEVIKFEVDDDDSANPESKAIQICDSFLNDKTIANKIQEIQPTFTIFPSFRHDGCLIPWAKFIGSIPVIWTRNPNEELYVFEYTGAALPVQNAGFWSRLMTSFSRGSILSVAKDEYTAYALRIAGKYFPDMEHNLENLYSEIGLILWGADTVLRSDFASLTQLLVEVGCHHCRGPLPLPGDLQKSLIEFRSGTVVVLLDDKHETLVRELAEKLPQGREGQAVLWKNKNMKTSDALPENLFVHTEIDRQDIIGYGRARVVLSHCSDTELLEAAFHGTPVICFPRNAYESRNAVRAVQLGFSRLIDETRDMSGEGIANTVGQIHEIGEYRENARKVSLAVRDRINPASDRLIYWLRYVARAKDQNLDLHAPVRPAKTFNEDLQFFFGLFVGSIVGVVSTIACIGIRYVVLSNSAQRSKGRYTR